MSSQKDNTIIADEAHAGTAWIFGDGINTDVLAPGQYIKLPIEELASHCLESVDERFARQVKPGDIVVAGRNFGIGSSREQAAEALRVLGVAAVIAESFGGIFYRNAINLGLPVFTPVASAGKNTTGTLATIKAGEKLSVSLDRATLQRHHSGTVVDLQPLPDFLLDMLKAGGLVAVLEKRFRSA